MTTRTGRNRRETPYVRVARFADEPHAGRVYFQLQQAILTAEPNDLSVFRVQLNGVYHVVVLGVPPPPALDQQLAAILAAGAPAELPASVLRTLQERRAQVTKRGTWWEAHYRPGRRL